MQRITISIDEALATQFDDYLHQTGYENRSEGVRDMVRQSVEAWRQQHDDSQHCVGTLSYICNHKTRSLAQRLSVLQHENHDLVVSTTVFRLDHDHSMECLILRGASTKVRNFADRIKAERGVRFGSLNVVGVDLADEHDDPNAHSHSGHDHLHPHHG